VKRLVAWLLHIANRHPPYLHRTEFYELKDRILKRHGSIVAYDTQHIVNECWGYYDAGSCQGAACRKCGGSGVFQEKWVALERWHFGRYTFHRPWTVVYVKPALAASIEGRIQHGGDARDSMEAAMWLALLVDRPLFRALFFRHGRSLTPGPRPLLVLSAWIYELRSAVRAVCPRRCEQCLDMFLQKELTGGLCSVCFASRFTPPEFEDIPF